MRAAAFFPFPLVRHPLKHVSQDASPEEGFPLSPDLDVIQGISADDCMKFLFVRRQEPDRRQFPSVKERRDFLLAEDQFQDVCFPMLRFSQRSCLLLSAAPENEFIHAMFRANRNPEIARLQERVFSCAFRDPQRELQCAGKWCPALQGKCNRRILPVNSSDSMAFVCRENQFRMIAGSALERA